jgi:hypothetical protein
MFFSTGLPRRSTDDAAPVAPPCSVLSTLKIGSRPDVNPTGTRRLLDCPPVLLDSQIQYAMAL